MDRDKNIIRFTRKKGKRILKWRKLRKNIYLKGEYFKFSNKNSRILAAAMQVKMKFRI